MRLTSLRKKILIVYAILVFVLCIFIVPWKLVNDRDFSSPPAYKYRAIWNAPINPNGYYIGAIDTARLSMELLALTIATGVIFLCVPNKD